MMLKTNLTFFFVLSLCCVLKAQDIKMISDGGAPVFAYCKISDTISKKNIDQLDGWSLTPVLYSIRDKSSINLDSFALESLPDSLHLLTTIIVADKQYSQPIADYILIYDTVSQKLTTIGDENPFSFFIEDMDLYYNEFLKTMRYVGKKTLYINGYTYATRHFSNAQLNRPHQELYLAEIGNYPIQTLAYDANNKLIDSSSSVLIKKFKHITEYGDFHKPIDTKGISIEYKLTVSDSLINIYCIPYGRYRNHDRNNQDKYSSVNMSLYLAKFIKEKDGIYFKYMDINHKEKLILYYPLSNQKVIRDYQYKTDRDYIDDFMQPFFFPYQKLLDKNDPMHNALTARFIGLDTLIIKNKKQSCYHFEESPRVDKEIFSTLWLYYSKIDTWIDTETLIPLKRKIWIKIKKETTPRLYREDIFDHLFRDRFIDAKD